MDSQDDDIAIATADENKPDDDSGEPIEHAPLSKDSLDDEAQFEDPIASPSVLDEESPAGDATSSEPMDIDDAMNQLGLETNNSDND